MNLLTTRRPVAANRHIPGRRRVSAGSTGTTDRLAVIDIGSNSIRLVIFDRMGRAPWTVFNEKVQCGLGKGLAVTGRLSDSGVISALDNLSRFVTLARSMKAGRIELLATAAVRDAENGDAFRQAVKSACGIDMRIVAGTDEAQLSAFGVIAGIPEAYGVMGDLGGGSLELVTLGDDDAGHHATLKIGHLRLPEEAGGDKEKARRLVSQALDDLPWLKEMKGKNFYPVGGAWRSLARMHMEQNEYPLHIIHHYSISGGDALDLVRLVGQFSRRSLAGFKGSLKKRGETLPFAAIVMESILKTLAPKQVVFCAYGLREGYHYSLLPLRERRMDPLWAACADMDARESRRPGLASAMDEWLQQIFSDDDAIRRRWRRAICLLSDIGWRDHPDYRAQHAFIWALRMPVYGVDHPTRVALAFALAVRYGGIDGFPDAEAVRPLLSKDDMQWAVAVGSALRLAYSIGGAAPEWLNGTRVTRDKSKLILSLPSGGRRLCGEALDRRLEALGKALGLDAQIDAD